MGISWPQASSKKSLLWGQIGLTRFFRRLPQNHFCFYLSKGRNDSAQIQLIWWKIHENVEVYILASYYSNDGAQFLSEPPLESNTHVKLPSIFLAED